MDFSKVDKEFRQWAEEFKLPIQTDYKGEEVRSTDIFDNNQKKWQLWLMPVNEHQQCVIHYWDYKDISRHQKVDNLKLVDTLTEIGGADLIGQGMNLINTGNDRVLLGNTMKKSDPLSFVYNVKLKTANTAGARKFALNLITRNTE